MKVKSSTRKFLIVLGLIALFYIGLTLYSDIGKIKDIYQKINIINIVPILSTYVLVMFVASLRQRFLLTKLGVDLSIKQSFLLYLAGLSMFITPFGSGQMIKSHFINKIYGYPTSQTIPLVLAERFNDLVIISVLIFVTVFIHKSLEAIVITVFSVSLLSVFLLALKNRAFLDFVIKVLQKIPIISKVFQEKKDFDVLIKGIFNAQIIVKAMAFTVPIILLEGFVSYLGFMTFKVNVDYLDAIQIYFTSMLAGAFSFIPGGVGVWEGNFANMLNQRNLDLKLITSLIILIRFSTIWFATSLGFIISYLITRRH